MLGRNTNTKADDILHKLVGTVVDVAVPTCKCIAVCVVGVSTAAAAIAGVARAVKNAHLRTHHSSSTRCSDSPSSHPNVKTKKKNTQNKIFQWKGG